MTPHEHYKNAMDKVTPSEAWQQDTLAKLSAARAEAPKKARLIRLPKKAVMPLAAAAAFALLLAPAALSQLGSGMAPVAAPRNGEAVTFQTSVYDSQMAAATEEGAPEAAAEAGTAADSAGTDRLKDNSLAFPSGLPTPEALHYQGISYGEFTAETGMEAQFFHADRFVAELPGEGLALVFEGSWDAESAQAILEDGNPLLRLEGSLSALICGVDGPLTPEALADLLTRPEGTPAAVTTEESGGTAYYISGSDFLRFQFDSDGSGVRNAQLDVIPSEDGTIGPDSYAWLSWPEELS